MPKQWERCDEQEKYLDEQKEKLAQARKDHRIERFKNDLYEGWFQCWPEEVHVFGKDWKKGDFMSFDDLCCLGTAIEKRKDQLYNYVRWHASGKVVRSQLSGVLKKFISKNKKATKRSRKNHKLELYSQKYYETRFKKHVDQEVLDTTPLNEHKKDFQKRKMTIYRKWRSLSWQMESDEVKAEIEALWNDKNAADDVSGGDKDAEGELDPEEAEHPNTSGYEQCDELGQLLTSFLRELQDQTGWCFTILGGGLNHEGEVKIVTSHVGKTTAGSAFPDVCNHYQENVLQEFFTFIKIQHPIEEHLLRAQVNNEQKSNMQETSGAAAIDVSKNNPGHPARIDKNHEIACNSIAGVAVSSSMTSGMMLAKPPCHPSPVNDNAIATAPSSMTSSAMLPEPPCHPSSVDTVSPNSFPNRDFQSMSQPFLPHSNLMASTPSFGFSTASATSQTLLDPDLEWMPYNSHSFSTPVTQVVTLPYDNLTPLSGFLARTAADHEAYSNMTTSDPSSLIFIDSTNVGTATTTSSQVTLSLINPASIDDVHLQHPIHTSSGPDCFPPSNMDSALSHTSILGSFLPIAQPVNRVTETCIPTNILTLHNESENRPENTMQVKSRKRSRKDEVDTSLVLPEGSTRAHKPRQMADAHWEAPAPKRSRKV